MSRLAIDAIVLALLAGCSRPHTERGLMTRDIQEEERIRDVVTSLVHELDGRRWSSLTPLFVDPVETDYVSLFGGEIQRQPASELVGTWQRILTPLDATHHQLGPIAVQLDGDRAIGRCHVRAYHVREGLPGGSEWMVAGHYIFDMVNADGSWKIRKLTLRTAYQTGNRKLLQEAGEVKR